MPSFVYYGLLLNDLVPFDISCSLFYTSPDASIFYFANFFVRRDGLQLQAKSVQVVYHYHYRHVNTAKYWQSQYLIV